MVHAVQAVSSAGIIVRTRRRLRESEGPNARSLAMPRSDLQKQPNSHDCQGSAKKLPGGVPAHSN